MLERAQDVGVDHPLFPSGWAGAQVDLRDRIMPENARAFSHLGSDFSVDRSGGIGVSVQPVISVTGRLGCRLWILCAASIPLIPGITTSSTTREAGGQSRSDHRLFTNYMLHKY